jgi:pyridine nucleotide-disulfide oxidoreductase
MLTMPMAAVLRTRTLSGPRGFMKMLIAADSDEILGFTALGAEASELTAAVQTAMIGRIPYTARALEPGGQFVGQAATTASEQLVLIRSAVDTIGQGTGRSLSVTGGLVGSSSANWSVPAGGMVSISLGTVPGSTWQMGDEAPAWHTPNRKSCGVGAKPRAWSAPKRSSVQSDGEQQAGRRLGACCVAGTMDSVTPRCGDVRSLETAR